MLRVEIWRDQHETDYPWRWELSSQMDKLAQSPGGYRTKVKAKNAAIRVITLTSVVDAKRLEFSYHE